MQLGLRKKWITFFKAWPKLLFSLSLPFFFFLNFLWKLMPSWKSVLWNFCESIYINQIVELWILKLLCCMRFGTTKIKKSVFMLINFKSLKGPKWYRNHIHEHCFCKMQTKRNCIWLIGTIPVISMLFMIACLCRYVYYFWFHTLYVIKMCWKFLGSGLHVSGTPGPEVEPTNGHRIPQSTMEVVVTNKMTRFRYDTELNNRNIGKEELVSIRVVILRDIQEGDASNRIIIISC